MSAPHPRVLAVNIKTIHFDDVKIVPESKYFVGKLSNMDPPEILPYKGSAWGCLMSVHKNGSKCKILLNYLNAHNIGHEILSAGG